VQVRHFEELRPECPTCRIAGRERSPLQLGTVALREADVILEGILICTEPFCQREHPIIDGIPIVVPDFRQWAQYQLDAVLRRQDLSPAMESLIGDAAGPDSGLDRDRNTLSTYASSHWGDHHSRNPSPRERTTAAIADAAMGMGGITLARPWIDLGCSSGRASFELGRRVSALVCGVDLNFDMLRLAYRIAQRGGATYMQRRLGLVYEPRDIAAPEFRGANVSFWCCDVTVLPFADEAFAGALSLNIVDSVTSPRAHLDEMRRVVEAEGSAIVSTPYEWTAQATPVEQWIGGHSQRGPTSGAGEPILREFLTTGRTDGTGPAWAIESERDGVPWYLSTHERSVVEYSLHVLRLGPPRLVK
jgi:SAM-dependent methyltransferase